MQRFVPPEPAALSERQRRVMDEVLAGRRGTVPANVLAWLPSPELAQRAAALGAFIRYETSLGARRSELAILVVARHWSCAYEWAVHAAEAAAAGVEAEAIAALARGETPELADADAAVYAFAAELVATGRVGDTNYTRVLDALGEAGVVDLIGVVGYYTLVAFTLNAREVPAPEGCPRLG